MQIIFLLLDFAETKGMWSPTQQVQAICDTLIALCDWTNCHSDLYNWEPFSLSQLYVSCTSLNNRSSKVVSLEMSRMQRMFFNSEVQTQWIILSDVLLELPLLVHHGRYLGLIQLWMK